MAVIIKKLPPPSSLPPITLALEKPSAPPPPPPPAVDVESRLALHSAATEKQIRELAVTMASALAALPNRQGPPPSWDFTVKYGPRGEITTIRAVANG